MKLSFSLRLKIKAPSVIIICYYNGWGEVMKEILRLDSKNYQDNWPSYTREAVKAIFWVENKLAMLQSDLGDVKFIGGGMEEKESHEECLAREIREETGYDMVENSMKEIGIIIERRKDKYKEAIWEMISYLYSCDIDSSICRELTLTENEKKHGMKCILITPSEAITLNEEALKRQTQNTWVLRELKLLKMLFADGNVSN